MDIISKRIERISVNFGPLKPVVTLQLKYEEPYLHYSGLHVFSVEKETTFGELQTQIEQFVKFDMDSPVC